MIKLYNELYKAFDFFNKELFNGELKNYALTIQAPKTKAYVNVLGWCSSIPTWHAIENDENDKSSDVPMYEVTLVANHLDRPFLEIMGTIIHEMVHLSNNLKDINDCSKSQFHNEKFRNEAERVGLICEKVPRKGWAATSLSPKLAELIENSDIDKSAFNFFKDKIKLEEKAKKKRKKKYKFICTSCLDVVYSEKEDLQVICAECNQAFERTK